MLQTLKWKAFLHFAPHNLQSPLFYVQNPHFNLPWMPASEAQHGETAETIGPVTSSRIPGPSVSSVPHPVSTF